MIKTPVCWINCPIVGVTASTHPQAIGLQLTGLVRHLALKMPTNAERGFRGIQSLP